ncbi:MAG: hypothetical protein CMA31_03545 [Euryarchaeota archaeon]|nr:hypothetical protein [Euryarchaeota archaeon]RPG73308.1 MAG: hypothetical protein CBD52_000200 [Euryarchaeota archaeon TMED192]
MNVLSAGGHSDPSDHRRRLLELAKEDLVEEVIRTWDALAYSEAELSEVRIKAGQLEIENAKIRGIRGVSTTKVEMADRIEELEREISVLSVKEDIGSAADEELARLREKEEALLTALLDLEREFASSQ